MMIMMMTEKEEQRGGLESMLQSIFISSVRNVKRFPFQVMQEMKTYSMKYWLTNGSKELALQNAASVK